MKTISVIIPAFNESDYLPGLLDALQNQSRPPLEIIIVDAGSKDNTMDIALRAGCRVIPGGRPARGRNAGALAARGDIFVFLDADVLPPRDFLAATLPEFDRRRLSAATCVMQPYDGTRMDAVMHQAVNWYMRAVRSIAPHAPGFCVFSRRWAHEAVGGFMNRSGWQKITITCVDWRNGVVSACFIPPFRSPPAACNPMADMPRLPVIPWWSCYC